MYGVEETVVGFEVLADRSIGKLLHLVNALFNEAIYFGCTCRKWKTTELKIVVDIQARRGLTIIESSATENVQIDEQEVLI